MIQAQELLTSQFNAGSEENNFGIYVIGETFNHNYSISNEMILEESILMVFSNENLKTDDVENVEIQVFPNPANDNLYIHSTQKIQTEIYDLTGKLILQTSENPIKTSVLPNGIYVIRISTNSGQYFTKKLIVQH